MDWREYCGLYLRVWEDGELVTHIIGTLPFSDPMLLSPMLMLSPLVAAEQILSA